MTSGHNNKHNPSYVQHRDFNHYDRVSANADVVVIGTCISYAGVLEPLSRPAQARNSRANSSITKCCVE